MSQMDPAPEAGDFHSSGESHAAGKPINGNGAVTNGALATLDHHGLPSVPSVGWYQGPPAKPEILSAKANPLELLHAVRRRWTLAIGLGTTVGTLLAALVWFLLPVQYTAFALLKVSGKPPAVLKNNAEIGEIFEVFKRSQIQLMLSGLVLQGAVREPDINRLGTVQQHNDDPVSWLREALVIDYPDDSEVLRVALKGRRRDDLSKIVNKVVDKYLTEIVQSERNQKLAQEDNLKKALASRNEEYQRQLKGLYMLEKNTKTSSSEAAQIMKRVTLQKLDAALTHRQNIHTQMADNAMQVMLMQARKNNPEEMAPPDHVIDHELNNDPTIQAMIHRRAALSEMLAAEKSASVRPNSPTIMNYRRMIDKLDQEIDEKKAAARPLLEEMYAQKAMGGKGGEDLSLPLLEKQKEYLDELEKEASDDIANIQEELANLENFSETVEAKKEELASLERTMNELRGEVNRAEVERLAAERIRSLDPASLLNPKGDAIRKYISVVFAFVLGFGLVVLGVAFVEFQSRRVNAVPQVNDGLGIRVIGELPSLSGRAFRRVRGGKGPAVLKALISERIDGTRTALIHAASIDPPRVVMVTSAEPREGKTTTATQLAASLARSGRRTLLIDGDIRNPGAHRVFEMAQEPGLCELLRNEVDRDAVVQPTRTANLWLLPAGRCDLASVQALSTSFLGTNIAALCVRFDYVIIDAGPVLKIADPLMIGQHVDAAILSVLRDVSQVPKVYEACERLHSVGITVLGSVVNGVNDDVARHGVELLMAETA